MATGWRRHGNGRHYSKPGLRAKSRPSGPACYRKESLPAAGWRREQYWRNATYTKSQTLPVFPIYTLKRPTGSRTGAVPSPVRSKKNLTEMGEWELGLSLPSHSGASRWSAMDALVEVQPQVKLTLTQTGLLIEDAEKSITFHRRGAVLATDHGETTASAGPRRIVFGSAKVSDLQYVKFS